MPLIKVEKERGIKHVFIAAEGIADLASVEIVSGSAGEAQVKMGTTGDEHLAAGISRGAVNSGALVRVITQGIVSGVKTAQAVQAGDRLTIATSGVVTPFKTITPEGVLVLASGILSGVASGFQGSLSGAAITGTAFNTGRLLGRALTSGLSGYGIQMIVCLE